MARYGAAAFAHLQVASSFSLQYGTATPAALAQYAAEFGHDIVGLTDRNGVYGAVRWVQACQRVGISPVLGVDLAVDLAIEAATGKSRVSKRRTPAHGGGWVDEQRPRVVFLARGARGWASLCRLISAAHFKRGNPWLSWSAIQANSEGVVALLGPDSQLGRHFTSHGHTGAQEIVRPWREIFGSNLHIAIANHYRTGRHPYSKTTAARMLGWAVQEQIVPVLTNAVRYLRSEDARVADVLDAARQLVPLTSRQIELGNGSAAFKSTAAMNVIAEDIATAAGCGCSELLRNTRSLAESCVIDGVRDLGLGEVYVPEREVLVGSAVEQVTAQAQLQWQCEQQIPERYVAGAEQQLARDRLADELRVIGHLGFAGYFLTVAEVVSMIKGRGVRVAARGSGAGCLVNHLLGISGVDPMRYGLLMERFLSPLRRVLPDIDIDVESARRLEVYDWIYERFGSERVACVSMMETYRVRHAVRDVGAALGLPPQEIDAFAKSFPHIRARDARSALRDLPELRSSGFGLLAKSGELDDFLGLVEALDGLPRNVAMHPCGVLVSDISLLNRTPVEPSAAGYPMSQFDKDDVEEMGLLKLDVLGVRMQSSIAHAIDEVERTTGTRIALDAEPLDDLPTFDLIRSTRTLGCFQIESPGQRELIGKFAPETFDDLIIDISLFRPGPVKSDMITPFLRARQGWCQARYIHHDLRPALAETYGVVVFHEQVLRVLSVMTGCSLAEADETRRSMNSAEGLDDTRAWFYPAALNRGYQLTVVEEVWEILRAFASFGFCKAHAAAFALPTYQSAWLKTHHPAAFYAGVLTHDPGMYPKRLILDDARNHGVGVLGLDINSSSDTYRVEADAIRVSFADVKGISTSECVSVIAGQPYSSLADAWHRSGMSRPTLERIVVSGAFDTMYGFAPAGGSKRRSQLTRRDLLLHIADLARNEQSRKDCTEQLSFDLGDDPILAEPSGLPEMTTTELVRAELDVLSMDVRCHVLDFHAPMLKSLGIVRSNNILSCRSEQEVLVAGVKVATQTPPVRSGRRVIFLTLDDSTGPVDATFFEDAQDVYASTVFRSWLVLVRGHVRRTGSRGVSIRATGCWSLGLIRDNWLAGGARAVLELLAADRQVAQEPVRRRVLLHPSGVRQSPYADVRPAGPHVGGRWSV